MGLVVADKVAYPEAGGSGEYLACAVPVCAGATEFASVGAPQMLQTFSPSCSRLPHVLQNIVFLHHSLAPVQNRKHYLFVFNASLSA
jgi:hypothetical protein